MEQGLAARCGAGSPARAWRRTRTAGPLRMPQDLRLGYMKQGNSGRVKGVLTLARKDQPNIYTEFVCIMNA